LCLAPHVSVQYFVSSASCHVPFSRGSDEPVLGSPKSRDDVRCYFSMHYLAFLQKSLLASRHWLKSRVHGMLI
jgi:hypothetical protein